MKKSATRKLKKEVKKTTMFVQDHGHFGSETLVIVGVPIKQKMLANLKKQRVRVDFSKWVLEECDRWRELTTPKGNAKDFLGLFCWNDDIKGTALILRPVEDNWEYWETAMHEVHHMVEHIAERKLMDKEREAKAYLFEYLFRKIRRKIMGYEKTE